MCIEICFCSPTALPKFHTHPESMAVDEGGVARFHCAVNGIPEASITWEKNRTTLNTDDERLNRHRIDRIHRMQNTTNTHTDCIYL